MHPQTSYQSFVTKDLTERPCACCNTFTPTSNTVVVRVDDESVDIGTLFASLTPATTAPDVLPMLLRQQFNVGGDLRDYLLSPHGVVEKNEAGAAVAVNICGDCHASLSKNRLPRRSLRNGNASFAVLPPELAACNEAELRFISLNSAGAKLICIGSGAGRASMVGHSFCMMGDLQVAVDAVLLPRSLKEVQDSLLIAFAGQNCSPEAIAALKKYRIRRSVIRAALRWLIANNPLYEHIVLCEEHLAGLPEENGSAASTCALVHSASAPADGDQLGESVGYAGPADLTSHGFAIADNMLLQGSAPASHVNDASDALHKLLRVQSHAETPSLAQPYRVGTPNPRGSHQGLRDAGQPAPLQHLELASTADVIDTTSHRPDPAATADLEVPRAVTHTVNLVIF